MPELPEVETVARQLHPLVEGRVVAGLRVFDERLGSAPFPPLAGARVVRVGRAGKQVLFAFVPEAGGGERLLAVHLRMTGRLVFHVEGGARRRYERARIAFRDGSDVSFVDPRRFGTFAFPRHASECLGRAIDPLDPRLTARALGELLGDSRQEIKPWLLRQDRLVGMGNIYASETLFEARISPRRLANSLSADEIVRLHRALRRVLRRAISRCGTTFSDFQDAHGMTGSYQALLRVYGREGDACPRCRGTVERIVQQQRSTFMCPRCVGERPASPERHPEPPKRRSRERVPAGEP